MSYCDCPRCEAARAEREAHHSPSESYSEYAALRSPLVTALLDAVRTLLESKIYVDAEQNALLIALEAAAEALRKEREQ